MLNFRQLVLVFIALLTAAKVTAVPLTGLYGPEFTFSRDGTSPGPPGRDELYAELKKRLIDERPDGEKFEVLKNYRLQSPRGWWLDLGKDQGVLEVTVSPMSVAEALKYKNEMQDAIFETSAGLGYYPFDFLGGGHLNFSLKIFGDDLLLARNFIVDFWNHNELAMGILNYDTHNALPMEMYFEASKAKIRDVLDRVDRGEYAPDAGGIMKFMIDLNIVQNKGKGAASWRSDRLQVKHHDLNVGHIGRVEIRSVRPQKNMDVWLSQIQLIEARINYLRKYKSALRWRARVPLKASPHFDVGDAWSSTYVPPIDPFQALKSFHEYLIESGQSWWDHKSYIWPAWQNAPAMVRLETSPGFKRRERRLRCEAGLKGASFF